MKRLDDFLFTSKNNKLVADEQPDSNFLSHL